MNPKAIKFPGLSPGIHAFRRNMSVVVRRNVQVEYSFWPCVRILALTCWVDGSMGETR